MKLNIFKKQGGILLAYIGIIAVIFIWGMIPSAKKALIGDNFSAAIYSTITTFFAACALLIVSCKQLKNLNKSYFKIAVLTGSFVGIAALCQAFAYNFDASPTNQAFLENISCIIVPILLFILTRKKAGVLTIIASVLCLLSSMILSGVFSTGLKLQVADILNALAGVFYGVNIALTGIYAKKFVASLYVMIQLFTQAFISAMMTIAFHFIQIDGASIDPIVFNPNPWLILAVIGIGVLTNAVCWTIRSNAMKYISPNTVAVLMPFSAVITGVFAIIIGQDTLSPTLVIGAVIGLIASLISSASDIKESKEEITPSSVEQ